MTRLLKNSFFRYQDLLYIFLLGFVSGVPFLLIVSTLSFWLTECGVSKSIIGSFMLISIPYSMKFLWAPLMDHLKIPFLSSRLGQRRGWALTMQVGLMISLWFLGWTNPATSIWSTAILAFFVSFFSASQDIVIDAYRVEILTERQSGTGAALETIGFRFGMITSGAGALYFATLFDWQTAYHLMALCILVGIGTVLLMPEPKSQKIVPLSQSSRHKSSFSSQIRTLFWAPCQQLMQEQKLLTILTFILCFKMGDIVLNSMSAPFLCDLGFSKLEFANVSKVFGITLMVIGGLLGGYIIYQMGIIQAVAMCAVLQTISCLMFTIQAIVGYDCSILMITVGTESLCSGLINAVFIAYLSNLCCQPYTATHFTLLYSFNSLCRVLVSAIAGWIADHSTWTFLFLITSMSPLPALYLLNRIQVKAHNFVKENKSLSHIA